MSIGFKEIFTFFRVCFNVFIYSKLNIHYIKG
nr:MAG TPA: hypothetical protein [Caudoviricetes sp.]